MTVRDILHHLEQVYGTRLSHETVSRITDAVLDEVRAWQDRPLDPVHAVVFLDAIMVKVRDNHVVQNKPAYIAIGIDADGEKHVLGIWPELAVDRGTTRPPVAVAGQFEIDRRGKCGGIPGDSAQVVASLRRPGRAE